MKRLPLLRACAASLLVGSFALGGVIEFDDKLGWTEAVGEFTTIDFTGFPEDMRVTDQYADEGILFTDTDDWIHLSDNYLNDGAGLFGGNTRREIEVAFDGDEFWIGVDFPGFISLRLFRNGELVYASRLFGSVNPGNFAGLLADEPFDSVSIRDPIIGFVFIDDLHFGPPIPAAPAIAMLGLAVVGPKRRRDCRC